MVINLVVGGLAAFFAGAQLTIDDPTWWEGGSMVLNLVLSMANLAVFIVDRTLQGKEKD